MKRFRFTKTDTSIAKLIAILLMILHHLFGFCRNICMKVYISCRGSR